MARTSILRIWLLTLLLCMGGGGIKFCLCNNNNNIEAAADGRRCIESERRALLDIGADICNPHIDWRSSWRNEGGDCCSWRGIGCDNLTGHVTSLDLRGSDDLYQYDIDGFPISRCASKLSPSLLDLPHLKHLDLSMNNFSGAPIPELIGSLVNLEYLNLSNANFGGKVPHELGNLSNLHSLDLHGNYQEDPFDFHVIYNLHAVELQWLSQTTSLSYLDLSFVNLSGAVDWIHEINMLPSLSVLKLSDCGLSKLPINAFANGADNFTRSLTLLDLSWNTFSSPLPSWLFNISSLVTLHLQLCGFYGEIPEMIGALRNLEYLDMSYNVNLHAVELQWLSQTTSLSYLALSDVNLSGAVDWIHDINMLPSLSLLMLRGCGLPSKVPKLAFANGADNFTRSLTVLDLSYNTFSSPLPSWLFNISSLVSLYLYDCGFYGEIPEMIGALRNLEYLDLNDNDINGSLPIALCSLSSLKGVYLSSNKIEGHIPEGVSNLTHLSSLWLGDNMISGQIPSSLWRLCNLRELDLSDNRISGQVLGIMEGSSLCKKTMQFGTGAGLEMLNLGSNNLSGEFPKQLGQLSSLSVLILSSNSFEGVLRETYFANLTHLTSLHLSHNQFYGTITNIIANLTRLKQLALSHNQFYGTITNIIANLTRLEILDLSYNQFHGTLPNINFSVLRMVDLSRNSFFGPLTLSLISITGGVLEALVLSQNQLNGSMPMSLCNFTSLKVLDLSNNKLTGRLPPCLNMSTQMEVLDLSNNSLTGWIPASIGSLTNLQSLHLGNNDHLGRIPKSIKHCNQLVTLDLAENRLSGSIPTWIGKTLSSLRVLSLRGNQFCGAIPWQLAHLVSLQVLDLSHNNLSGTISIPFGNFSAMVSVKANPTSLLKAKGKKFYKENLLLSKDGQYLYYSSVLEAVTTIDISSNSFSGEFPRELTRLSGLLFLNMSNNHFTGHIPENIGGMGQLELLDLSMNNFSGKIPSSITNLNFLSHLNLSNNKLSGRIPYGNQLQTLPGNSYNGNDGLCGWPLQQCPDDQQPDPHTIGQGMETHDDRSEEIWIYAFSALGFVVGFWASFGTIMMKQSVRHAYFYFVDKLFDRVYVVLAVNFCRFKTMMAQKSKGHS